MTVACVVHDVIVFDTTSLPPTRYWLSPTASSSSVWRKLGNCSSFVERRPSEQEWAVSVQSARSPAWVTRPDDLACRDHAVIHDFDSNLDKYPKPSIHNVSVMSPPWELTT